MNEEFNALLQQGTWTLVPPPANRKIIGCKWVFKLKLHADGSIARHKARLVAKGYDQIEGLDYFETFSPVVRQPTIRIVLSMTLHYKWNLRQLDVSNAFLHGLLDEDIYMCQPPGFIDQNLPNHVCKLKKSLYGLKQAPRTWFSTLSSFLVNHGFHNSIGDSSLFINKIHNHIIIVLVYVDDLIITGSSDTEISALITSLQASFMIKDLGKLHYFLGIEVRHTSTGLFLSQQRYIKELLDKAGMIDSKSVQTPMATKTNVPTDHNIFNNPTLYRMLVGSLQYVTITRPEIAYSVNCVCQAMQTPTQSDFSAVKRILRYLQGTMSLGLLLQPGPLDLLAYSDSDWAGDPITRRSITGSCIFLGPNPLIWTAKKQTTVAKSSTEAEYRALSYTTMDMTWIRILLQDLHIKLPHAPIILCDNVSAISLSANPILHSKTKHIQIDFHFVREKVLAKEITIKYISTLEQLADVFTKPLSSNRFLLLRSKLMVVQPPSV